MVNTKLLGILGVFLLVAGIWSVTSVHLAEAKGMPKCWLNSDDTEKILSRVDYQDMFLA